MRLVAYVYPLKSYLIMHKPLFRTTLLATALGFSSLAFAATSVPANDTSPPPPSSSQMQHGTHHYRGHHRDSMGALGKLDLTATQRTNIEQMMREDRAQARPQMQALMQTRMAFENATPGSADYQTAAEQLAQAEAKAAQARVMRQADLRTKIYNELTAQQRTELASLRSQRQARMQKWRANRAAHKADKPAPATTSAVQP